jgi:hypothetical protein
VLGDRPTMIRTDSASEKESSADLTVESDVVGSGVLAKAKRNAASKSVIQVAAQVGVKEAWKAGTTGEGTAGIVVV